MILVEQETSFLYYKNTSCIHFVSVIYEACFELRIKKGKEDVSTFPFRL